MRIAIAAATLLLVGAVAPCLTNDRPRLIVLTDYYKDPDDKQSMIRLLTYANELDLEGLIATSLAYGDGSVHPEWIKEAVNHYQSVYPSLRRHEKPGYEYPTADSLRAVVRAGAPVVRKWVGHGKGFPAPYPPGANDSRSCDPASEWIGPGRDTEASELIIAAGDRDDPRSLWIVVWGGSMDLAQALWKVREERSWEEADRFIAKLRVYQISWQDTGSVWIWNNFPKLFLIQSAGLNQGIYREGPANKRDREWVRMNVSEGHGPLAATYPQANPPGVKEGDTPSFLHLLARGLADPEHPEWGGWGGRFRRLVPNRRFYVPARDRHPSSTDPERESQWTIGRWNEAIANDFEARLDWCVRGPREANHRPIAIFDGDASHTLVHRRVKAGERVWLDATGTYDPDGDEVAVHWVPYREAGTLQEPVAIERTGPNRASFFAPKVDESGALHIVMQATDDGEPPLTAYRRVIVTVNPGETPTAP